MTNVRPPLAIALAACVAAAVACSSSSTPNQPNVPMMRCAPPIGEIPQEDCAAVATDFSVLDVSAALTHVGKGREAELRTEAIKSAAALAEALKKKRVDLCQSYTKCEVSRDDHTARDQRIAKGMEALIDLWQKRKFSRADEVVRFRDALRAIELRALGDEAAAPPPPPAAPKGFKAADALARVDGAPGVTFPSAAAGAIAAVASGPGRHEVIRSKRDVASFTAGHRYRVKVRGSFTPEPPPLIRAGDELTLRLKARAAQPAEIVAGLRSIEDPENLGEGAASFKLTAGDKGPREAKLVADERASGFSLVIGVRGSSADLDDIEVLRGSQIIAAARAENGEDTTAMKIDCASSTDKPLAGKQSFRCAPGEADRIVIGAPQGYLEIVVVDSASDRGALKTHSLQGGRSLDVNIAESSEIIFRIYGGGSLTVEGIELTDLGTP